MKLQLSISMLIIVLLVSGCIQTSEPPEKPQIIKGPGETIMKYKGVWLPFMRETRVALNEINELKEDGINIVAIGVKICKGEEFYVCEDAGEIKDAINEFHRNGIRTFLLINPAHPDFDTDFYPPTEDPKEIIGRLNPLVLEWAKISEEYGVEMFSPVNEVHLLAEDDQTASEWAQEILREIKKVYRGNVAFRVQSMPEGVDAFDLKGYDYIALGGIPATRDVEDNPGHMENLIREKLDSLEHLYPDQKHVLLDVGAFTGPDYYWWEPIAPENMEKNNPGLPKDFFAVSDEGQARFYEMLFNLSWNRTSGYFIPVYKGWEYRGKPAEETIRKWFNS